MATILVRTRAKLTRVEARAVISEVEAWFAARPKRRACKTSLGVLGLHTFHRTKVIAEVRKLTA